MSNRTTYRQLLPFAGTLLAFLSFRYACYVKDKSNVFVWLHYTVSRESVACHLLPYGPVTASAFRRTGNLASSTSRRSRSGLVGNWLTAVRSYKCAVGCNCSAHHFKWSRPRACLRIEWRRGTEASVAFVGKARPCHHHFRPAGAAISAVFTATASYFCPSAAGQRT